MASHKPHKSKLTPRGGVAALEQLNSIRKKATYIFLCTLTCNWIIWPRYPQRFHENNSSKKVLKSLERISELNRAVV